MSPGGFHLVHVFATFDEGGPQVRTTELIRRLPSGYRHTLLAMDGRLGCRHRLPEGPGARCLELPFPPGSSFAWLRLLPLLRRLEPDLCLTYNWGALDAILAARLGRLRPVLHHVDGFRPDEVSGQKRRRVFLRRLFFPGLQGLVVPSEGLYEIATQSWRLDPDRVHLLRNGIDTEHFRPGDREEARRSLGLPLEAFLVGTVGGLRAIKNQALLLGAFAGLDPGCRLVLAGEGEEEAALREEASRLGVGERVHFLGRRADLRPVFRSLDLFALSSDSEQMPVSVLEAMASGLPLVSTDVGDLRLVLPEGQREFLSPPGEEEALRDHLSALWRDPRARRELGRANRKQAEEKFPVSSMVESYDRIYRSLLPEGRGPSRGK